MFATLIVGTPTPSAAMVVYVVGCGASVRHARHVSFFSGAFCLWVRLNAIESRWKTRFSWFSILAFFGCRRARCPLWGIRLTYSRMTKGQSSTNGASRPVRKHSRFAPHQTATFSLSGLTSPRLSYRRTTGCPCAKARDLPANIELLGLTLRPPTVTDRFLFSKARKRKLHRRAKLALLLCESRPNTRTSRPLKFATKAVMLTCP